MVFANHSDSIYIPRASLGDLGIFGIFHLSCLFIGDQSGALDIFKCSIIEDTVDYADWEYFGVGRCLLGSFVTFYRLVYYFKCCGLAEDSSGYDKGNKQQCVNEK